MNRARIAPDEWYHCYSRGVDKRTTFEDERDYKYFVQLLYLCNSSDPIQRSDLSPRKHNQPFTSKRGTALVSIGTYCLMPNHFHLLLKDCTDGGDGISRFMQKLGIAYTSYFNKRRERVGNLFVKPFRSRYVEDNRYFMRVAQYIHFNPIEIFEPEWKKGIVSDLLATETKLQEYQFSSLPDYLHTKHRPEHSVLDTESQSLIASGQMPLKAALAEMKEYYESLH